MQKLSEIESGKYFQMRPRFMQLYALASNQSCVIESKEVGIAQPSVLKYLRNLDRSACRSEAALTLRVTFPGGMGTGRDLPITRMRFCKRRTLNVLSNN